MFFCIVKYPFNEWLWHLQLIGKIKRMTERLSSADLRCRIQNINLTCSICNDVFKQPKALPCLHTYCAQCLREFIYSRAYDTIGRFPCPLCRLEVNIPVGGVDRLMDNFHVTSLLDTVRIREPVRPPVSRVCPPERPPIPIRHVGSLPDIDSCFGRYGNGAGDFTKPVGLAVSTSGFVVVSDQRDNRIMIYDLCGNIKKVFACDHTINAIATTERDSILVTNSQPGQPLAIEYTFTGAPIRCYGNFNRLEIVHGVAVLTSPFHVILSSYETSTVYVLSDGDRMVQKLSSRGTFGQPYHLASNSRHDIIVSDYLNHAVKVFDRLGKLRLKIGSTGSKNECLYQPLGVCTDEDDNIIVADSGNRCVKVFSPIGKFCRTVVDMSRLATLTPQNVAMATIVSRLVVLVIGDCCAEVRVYPYTSMRRQHASSVCACQ